MLGTFSCICLFAQNYFHNYLPVFSLLSVCCCDKTPQPKVTCGGRVLLGFLNPITVHNEGESSGGVRQELEQTP